jgi:uncharacterized protein (DUF1330 family)
VKGYLVFTRDKMLDKDEMAAYSKEVPATFAGHEIKILALYGAHEDLEGAATEGSVIVEFPSIEAARPGTTAQAIARRVSIVSKGRLIASRL